ncbi:MAG: hypothetical protein AABY58_10300 [Nitrospirota bacterium]
MRAEYDFTDGVRSKHYRAMQVGYTITIHKADGTIAGTGKKIAGHIWKYPAVVPRYLREKEELWAEVKRVREKIKRANVNKQV